MGIRHILGIILTFLSTFSGANLYGGDAIGAGTPTVTHGGADVNRVGDNLTITTHNDRTIIDWDRFGVPGGSLTHFAQPSRSSATLNRVSGGIPSRIDGSLTSNGAVFLVNPRGVTVGPTGVVRADGGFVASTMTLSDRDFISGATGGGALRFLSPGDGSVGMAANEGVVESAYGDVFFIGTRVENSGTVDSPRGTAGFAAGGGGNVIVQPIGGSGARFEIVPNANSFYEGAGVRNSGVVTAAAAELIANGDAYRLAVNNSGLVSARGVDSRPDGSVYLTAMGARGTSGSVVNMGTLRAVDADGSGGAVRMTGGDVTLASKSLVDVSADATGSNGGVALIGGEFQGGRSLSAEERAVARPNALTTTVESEARILADATADGNGQGGLAVVWADELTVFDGHISARGGKNGGAGGFVEVSGKRDLRFSGTVDTTAPMGKTGTLLLDPANVTIAATGGTIDPATLVSALGSSNVVVFTDTTGSGDGNIFVNDDVEWNAAASGNNSLTLLAYNNIVIQANLRNFTPGSSNNTTGSANTGNLTLVAGWNGTGWTPSAGSLGNGNFVFTAPTTLGELRTANWFGNTAGRATTYTVGGTPYQGSIVLDATHRGVNVGSRNGSTTLFGNNIILLGGSTSSRSAHIGYASIEWHAPASNTEQISSGDIAVYAKNSLLLAGGYNPSNDIANGAGHAQIGHGGYTDFSGITGDRDYSLKAESATIEILAGNSISLTGGSAVAYAHIGHGGYTDFTDATSATKSNWDLNADSAEISIEAGGSIALAGGGTGAYAQVGHGGHTSEIDWYWWLWAHGAPVAIRANGDITLTSSEGHAQIGHGGYTHHSSPTVNSTWHLDVGSAGIEVESGGKITLNGSASNSHSQIGHGGIANNASNIWYLHQHSNNGTGLSVTAGAITAANSASSSHGVALGHVVSRRINSSHDGYAALPGSFSGNMSIHAVSGGITFANPNIGHPYIFHSGSGSFSLITHDSMTLTSSSGAGKYDFTGFDMVNQPVSGYFWLTNTGDVNLYSTHGDLTLAQPLTGTSPKNGKLLLAAGGRFVNIAGDAALSSERFSRWLVWIGNSAGSDFGGLSLTNSQYGVAAPNIMISGLSTIVPSFDGNGFLFSGSGLGSGNGATDSGDSNNTDSSNDSGGKINTDELLPPDPIEEPGGGSGGGLDNEADGDTVNLHPDNESNEHDDDQDNPGKGDQPEEPGPEPEAPADMPTPPSEDGYPAVQGDVNRDGAVDAMDAQMAENGDLGYHRYISEKMKVYNPATNSQPWRSLTTDERVEYLKRHGNEMYNPSDDVKFQQLRQTFENWLNQGNNRERYEKYRAEIEAWNAKKTIYEKWTAAGGF